MVSNAYVPIVKYRHTVLNLHIMARVQYGTIVTALKGNIAGQTFQNGHVSKVLRNKGYRKGATSIARSAQTHKLAQVTSSWRNLGLTLIGYWNASAGNWPFKDKFGNTYYGSGYQKYVAQNTALLSMYFPMTEAPDLPLSADNPGLYTISVSATTGITVAWANTPTHDQNYFIFVSPQRSIGRNANNPRYILLQTNNMNGLSDVTINSAYTDLYGPLFEGSGICVKVFIRTQQFPIIQFPYSQLCEITA